MVDLALQLLLAGGGFLAGLINRLVNNSHEFKKFALAKSFEDVEKARHIRDPRIAWTRRVLALIVVISIFVMPTVVNIIWGLPTFIGYQESNGFFTSLFSGDWNIVWKQLPAGLILTQYHFSMCSLVLGFYFGRGSNNG